MKPVAKEILGTTADGRPLEHYTLTHPDGRSVAVLNWGAVVTSLRVPDGDGHLRDVVLGLASCEEYVSNNPFYLGTAVGRTAGRIFPARLTIGPRDFLLTQNEGDKHLHGGICGLHNMLWHSAIPDPARPAVRLETELPDGLEGYPGNVRVSFLCEWTEAGALHMEYRATTDLPTLFNPTRHDYFNLGGHQSGEIGSHVVRLSQSRYLPVDELFVENLPPRGVEGTVIDFRKPKPLGSPLEMMEPRLRGINYGFLNEGLSADEPAAEIFHPESGIRLRFFTNQRCLQFYTGNFLDDTIPAKEGARYDRHHGFCLEAQNFANGINTPEWAGDCLLRPGEESIHSSTYHFDIQTQP